MVCASFKVYTASFAATGFEAPMRLHLLDGRATSRRFHAARCAHHRESKTIFASFGGRAAAV